MLLPVIGLWHIRLFSSYQHIHPVNELFSFQANGIKLGPEHASPGVGGGAAGARGPQQQSGGCC
jgi:hypothetical protein